VVCGQQALRIGAGGDGRNARGSDPGLHIVTGSKGLVMEWNLVRRSHDAELVACSLCLRVRRGSAWIEAAEVIRELRSYELPAAPRLQSGVCDDCADAIFDRRAQAEEEAIAA
jgi:hypothetical protein